jgi:hypothetical protein
MISNIIPISVCVNYDDFLSLVLLRHRSIFKDYYIITVKEDHNTINLCKKYNITCIIYDNSKDGNKFNKSAMLYQLQKIVHNKYPESWILIIDADCIVPASFEAIWLQRNNLINKDMMYSLERIDYQTYNDYIKQINKCEYTNRIGAGYFQLYYDKSKYYPENSENASECDILFLNKFSIYYNIATGSDCKIIHLGKDGINHGGRITEPFIESNIYCSNIECKYELDTIHHLLYECPLYNDIRNSFITRDEYILECFRRRQNNGT